MIAPADIARFAVSRGVPSWCADDCVQSGALSLLRQRRPLDSALWQLAACRAWYDIARRHNVRRGLVRRGVWSEWYRRQGDE